MSNHVTRQGKTRIAESIIQVAAARAVQMYRSGADQEAVYWTLLHAGLTAELVLG